MARMVHRCGNRFCAEYGQAYKGRGPCPVCGEAASFRFGSVNLSFPTALLEENRLPPLSLAEQKAGAGETGSLSVPVGVALGN